MEAFLRVRTHWQAETAVEPVVDVEDEAGHAVLQAQARIRTETGEICHKRGGEAIKREERMAERRVSPGRAADRGLVCKYAQANNRINEDELQLATASVWGCNGTHRCRRRMPRGSCRPCP